MRFVLPVMNVQLKPMDGAFAAARQQSRDSPLDRAAFATAERERKDSDRPNVARAGGRTAWSQTIEGIRFGVSLSFDEWLRILNRLISNPVVTFRRTKPKRLTAA